MSIASCFISIYASTPSRKNKITLLTILTTAMVFPLLEMPNAKPTKIKTGMRYASSPKMPNIALLMPVAAAPFMIPVIHKNIKIAAAKMTISITSFFTAMSTLFLAAFLPLALDVVFLEPPAVLLDVLFFVFVLLLDARFSVADAIILLPLNEFYKVL